MATHSQRRTTTRRLVVTTLVLLCFMIDKKGYGASSTALIRQMLNSKPCKFGCHWWGSCFCWHPESWNDVWRFILSLCSGNAVMYTWRNLMSSWKYLHAPKAGTMRIQKMQHENLSALTFPNCTSFLGLQRMHRAFFSSCLPYFCHPNWTFMSYLVSKSMDKKIEVLYRQFKFE